MPATPLRERKAWQALERHYAEISGTHLRELFAADPGRGERLTAEAVGIYLDYSKNRVAGAEGTYTAFGVKIMPIYPFCATQTR